MTTIELWLDKALSASLKPKQSMIVTGCSPPYQYDPRTIKQSSWDLCVGKLPISRSTDETLYSSAKTSISSKNADKQRPKSSPLKISEKILRNLNMDREGTLLTYNSAKSGENGQKAIVGAFTRKGFHFKMVQPGYFMARRRDGINVALNMDELCTNKGKIKCSIQDERVPTMKTLQQEIIVLNKTLTEERITHGLQFKQFIENTKVDVQVMLQEHRDHIKSIEEDHKEEMEKLTDMYETRLIERKAQAKLEAARLQQEIDSVRASLESCKEDVVDEMNEKWREEKKQLATNNQLKTEELLDQQKVKLEHLKDVELNHLKQNHDQELKKHSQQHHKEMSAVLEKFVTCADDAEKLKDAQSDREKLKQEVDELRELYSEIKKQLKKSQNELADAKVTLQGYELSFSEKVAEVEERYAMKIHGLMLNNTDIRRNYMKKCTELLDVQTKTDFAQKKTTKKAKTKMQTIILARTKTEISLTTSTEKVKQATTQTSRPKSAPIIKQKTFLQDNSSLSDPQTTQYRPNSSLI